MTEYIRKHIESLRDDSLQQLHNLQRQKECQTARLEMIDQDIKKVEEQINEVNKFLAAHSYQLYDNN